MVPAHVCLHMFLHISLHMLHISAQHVGSCARHEFDKFANC